MQNEAYEWGNNRRYNAYTNWCMKKFGSRLQKVSLDAGFTCPNRDGRVSKGGCIYCNNNGFNPSYCNPEKTISQQLKEGIEFLSVRYRRTNKYIAYFQAYSNTYAPLEKLKKLYEEALSYEGVIGLSIGTRPDCIDDEKLDYLQKLNEKYFITVEYGVESSYNKTLEKINRGHTFEKSVESIEETAKRKINTGIHLIFGLPTENQAEMLKEAEIISKLPIHSVKFHQLQILKDTQVAEDYKNNPEKFNFFNLDEYINFVIDFVEMLNPEITIERFTSEVPPRMIVGPNFGTLRTDQILQLIEKRMEERNTWQGKFFIK